MKKNNTKYYKKNYNKSRFKHKAYNLLNNSSTKNIYYKYNYSSLYIIFHKSIKLLLIILLLIIFLTKVDLNNQNQVNSYGLSLEQKMNDYATKRFALFRRRECFDCGLFSY